MEEEKQLKGAVIDKGGVWNTSCLFLKNTCDAVVVNSTTGVTRKGVMKIMRPKVPEETLFMLDACKCLIIDLTAKLVYKPNLCLTLCYICYSMQWTTLAR